jgi:leader peptidase (prepilin peptidase)/N-methyltransferase
MNALILAAACGYGAIIGSFLNVCVFRLPRRCLRIWRPKLSFCPACTRTIPWHENLPLLSYLALLGRCRGCRASIPFRYFLVELVTTVFFAVTAAEHLLVAADGERAWGVAIVQALLFAALLVCALVDWDHYIIPDEIDIPGFLVAPVVCALVPDLLVRKLGWLGEPRLDAAAASILGALTGAALIWTIRTVASRLAGREAMGFGDVKFLAMIGGFMGWQGAVSALLLACVVGSFYGIARWLRGGDNVVPFGPWLAVGGALFGFVPAAQEKSLELLDMYSLVFRPLWDHLPWRH